MNILISAKLFSLKVWYHMENFADSEKILIQLSMLNHF